MSWVAKERRARERDAERAKSSTVPPRPPTSAIIGRLHRELNETKRERDEAIRDKKAALLDAENCRKDMERSDLAVDFEREKNDKLKNKYDKLKNEKKELEKALEHERSCSMANPSRTTYATNTDVDLRKLEAELRKSYDKRVDSLSAMSDQLGLFPVPVPCGIFFLPR